MSLATRCPSCGTVFRVVQDQLRVSEGWVRCGRCNGVFNAAEVLFDIDSGATVGADLGLPGPPAEAPRPAAPSGYAPIEPPPPADNANNAANAAWSGGRQEPRFDTDANSPWMPDGRTEEPLLRAPSRHHDDLADEIVITDHVPAAAPNAPSLAGSAAGAQANLTTHWSTSPAASPPLHTGPGLALADEARVSADFSSAGAAAASAAAGPSPVQALPSFLRTAERDALWRRPAMRAAAAVGVLLLAIVLVLQAAVLWRDSLAARWPASAPALTALCRLAGCSVQPLRRIDALSVHSSGLNRLEGSTLYRLQVVLQNRADTAVMMPALELTLNDAQGKLVARRVLQAAELGAPQTVLQAAEELPIKALVSTGERRVDGYTLELFYP
jgi:predicted Zn finger-like uncharacterized protein